MSPPWTNQNIALFHGTLLDNAQNILHHGIDTSIGAPNVDFGSGFYTTPFLRQAQDWAASRAAEQGGASAVVKLTLDRLELRRLRSLVFVRGSPGAMDYWSFVRHCRRKNQRGPATGQYYDVVYGPVARTWFAGARPLTFRNFDQISFHGNTAQTLLRNPKHCTIEILS